MTEKDAIITRLRAALPDLRRRWPIGSLALFGSVVRDEATAESDLDLLVEVDKPIDLFAFLALAEELAGLAGRRVDLVSRAALKRHMGQRILAEVGAAVTAERDYRDFLEDLVGACRSIIGLVAGMSFDAYPAGAQHHTGNDVAHCDMAPNIWFRRCNVLAGNWRN